MPKVIGIKKKRELHPEQGRLAADLFVAKIIEDIDVDVIAEQEAAMLDAMELAEEFFQLYNARYQRGEK